MRELAAHRRPASALALAAALIVPGAVTGFGLAVPAAQAQQAESRSYDIPPGPLGEVLTRFAAAAGLLLSGEAALADDQRSPGLEGTYTVEQALRRLLAGTGLQYRFSDPETVTLVRAKTQDAGGPLQLGPIQVTGQTESAYGPVEGYSASRSATATRTDTPIAETPVSIQVVPRDVIRDQGAFDAAEVYRNVSGTRPGFTQADVAERVSAIIRGFEPQIYYNGFPTRGVSILDLANVERLEVLKGPASMTFGQVEPGGLVNIVPEAPRPEPFAEVEQRIGS